MIGRRTSTAAAVCLAALILLSTAADAGVPEGPRVAFVEKGLDSENAELRTAAPDGTDIRPLGNPRSVARAELVPGLPLAWSPDGSRFAVEGFRSGSVQIYTATVAREGLRILRGTDGGFAPVLSPDGRTLAFTRLRRGETDFAGTSADDEFESSSIWTVDLVTGRRDQLTPWRNGLHLVSGSYSSDGTSLVASRSDERRGGGTEIVSVDAATGHVRPILDHGVFPVYSPDGSMIAFLRQRNVRIRPRRGPSFVEVDFDLFVANADGSGVRRLTRTQDDSEFWPSFDPSGERLAFSALPNESSGTDRRETIDQINVDGTCRSTLLADPKSDIAVAAWRPGPGREAGRIAC